MLAYINLEIIEKKKKLNLKFTMYAACMYS